MDQLRSDIALDLVLFGVPETESTLMGAADWTGLLPAGMPTARVDVVVSLASLVGYSDTPGDMPGHGPVPAAVVRDLAIAEGSTWARLVTDPATGHAVDAEVATYRPPPAMARYVRARDGGCRAPGCAAPATRTDLDHVHPRHDGGPTAAANLQTLNRGHHAPKTAGLWKATLARGGDVTWDTLTGRTYTTHPKQYDDGLAPPAATTPKPRRRRRTVPPDYFGHGPDDPPPF